MTPSEPQRKRRGEPSGDVGINLTVSNPRNQQRVVLWPHETEPGRCIHWPKTCAEIQTATYSKPCAHCCPALYEVPSAALPSPHHSDGERVEQLSAEFERLGAMATSPAHRNIWNSAADKLCATFGDEKRLAPGVDTGDQPRKQSGGPDREPQPTSPAGQEEERWLTDDERARLVGMAHVIEHPGDGLDGPDFAPSDARFLRKLADYGKEHHAGH